MESPPPPFRYRLAPLLRRDEWERDQLGSELQRSRLLVEQAHQRWQAAVSQVSAAESQMRALHAQDATFSLAHRQRLHAFIEQAHGAVVARLQELRHVHGLMEQVQQQFDGKRLAVRTLEKHRERRRGEHDQEQERRTMSEADERWITRGARR